MTGKITITNIGETEGPFNLYSDVDGYSSAFEAEVTRQELLDGFGTDNLPDGTVSVRATSTSSCNSSIDIAVTIYTTTTTTTEVAPEPPVTTTTTTIPPVTTTTTTLFPPVTTTTTTTAAVVDCTLYEVLNTNEFDAEYAYVACGETVPTLLYLAAFETSQPFCAVTDSIILELGMFITSEALCP
jgi:hypothetical protein